MSINIKKQSNDRDKILSFMTKHGFTNLTFPGTLLKWRKIVGKRYRYCIDLTIAGADKMSAIKFKSSVKATLLKHVKEKETLIRRLQGRNKALRAICHDLPFQVDLEGGSVKTYKIIIEDMDSIMGVESYDGEA